MGSPLRVSPRSLLLTPGIFMKANSEASMPRNVTRRKSLVVLGSAMMLGGCGGAGGAAGAGSGAGGAIGSSGSVAGNGGSGGVTGAGSGAGGGTEIKLASNQIVVFGDSRTANATQYANTTATNRVTADSYIGYAVIASKFSRGVHRQLRRQRQRSRTDA
jgi:hypothetical protein